MSEAVKDNVDLRVNIELELVDLQCKLKAAYMLGASKGAVTLHLYGAASLNVEANKYADRVVEQLVKDKGYNEDED